MIDYSKILDKVEGEDFGISSSLMKLCKLLSKSIYVFKTLLSK